MFLRLHRDMKARVNFNSSLSKPISVDPSPFFPNILLYLSYAFQHSDIGVYIRFRTTGKIFDLTRFKTKPKTFPILVREFLYADDADFVVHTESEMQAMMNIFSRASSTFEFTITPHPGQPNAEPKIFVFRIVLILLYTLEALSLEKESRDSEIKPRIENVCKCLKSSKIVSQIKTKVSVYESCVLTALTFSIEINNQMRWAGYLTKMEDVRLPKQLFHGKLQTW